MEQQTQIDFSQLVDDPEEGLTPERLASLTAMLKREAELAHEITELESGLKDLKAEQRKLVEVTIPELLADAQLDELKLADGTKVTVKENLRVSTTGKWRDPINEFLERTGQEDLIRNELTLAFPADADELVDEAIESLRDFGLLPENHKRNRYVNAQSFAALLREMLRDGEEVPLDDLGAHVQKFADITRPKGNDS